jgi:hypothetical protein
MKKLLLVTLLLLTACQPSEQAIQTAMAQTQAAYTATPSQTPTATFTSTATLTPSPTFTSTFTATPDPQLTADGVIATFKAAGLEAEGAFHMGPQDYGLAPFVCYGVRFLVPSLGPDNGGRVFICNDSAEQAQLAAYYDKLGKSSALFFSWVFIKGNVLVQINGDLPEAIARQYEVAIP